MYNVRVIFWNNTYHKCKSNSVPNGNCNSLESLGDHVMQDLSFHNSIFKSTRQRKTLTTLHCFEIGSVIAVYLYYSHSKLHKELAVLGCSLRSIKVSNALFNVGCDYITIFMTQMLLLYAGL
jgi:hypothetical protein